MKKNPNKGKRYDKESQQWLSKKDYQKLSEQRKIIAKSKYLANKPYSKWTKADKAFAEKHNTSHIKRAEKSVKNKESSGLKAQGFKVGDAVAKAILSARSKYPEIARLSRQAQERFEYSLELIKDGRGKAAYKKVVQILVKKAVNKESGIEKGHWITEDEDKFVCDTLEEWDIPEDLYSSVYGSDVI